eukprot:4782555-Lingulodinium_polyedra.AAC.1
MRPCHRWRPPERTTQLLPWQSPTPPWPPGAPPEHANRPIEPPRDAKPHAPTGTLPGPQPPPQTPTAR